MFNLGMGLERDLAGSKDTHLSLRKDTGQDNDCDSVWVTRVPDGQCLDQ
jgi:hypothetical protein